MRRTPILSFICSSRACSGRVFHSFALAAMPVRDAFLGMNKMIDIAHRQRCLTESIRDEIHADSIFGMCDVADGVYAGDIRFKITVDRDAPALQIDSPIVDRSNIRAESETDQDAVHFQSAFIACDGIAYQGALDLLASCYVDQFVLGEHIDG